MAGVAVEWSSTMNYTTTTTHCIRLTTLAFAISLLFATSHFVFYAASQSDFTQLKFNLLQWHKNAARIEFRRSANNSLQNLMTEAIGPNAMGFLRTHKGQVLKDLTFNDCLGGNPDSDCWAMISQDPDFGIEKTSLVVQGQGSYNVPHTPEFHDSKYVFNAHYPNGTFAPKKSGYRGGHGWYGHPLDLSNAMRVLLIYRVYFPKDWDPHLGGKLPGIMGGTSVLNAMHCSGGVNAAERNCFSSRFMWREENFGEAYLYVPGEQEVDYCYTEPRSVCNPAFGDSIGRGSFTFQPGWNTVAMDVMLNSPDKHNGHIQVFYNGSLVLSNDRILWRKSADVRLQVMTFETFFGGGSPQWATPKDQNTYFTDFVLVKLSGSPWKYPNGKF